MSDPKPPPQPDPRHEGGLKTPPQTTPAPQETGAITEGEGAPPPRDDREGGMIGEG